MTREREGGKREREERGERRERERGERRGERERERGERGRGASRNETCLQKVSHTLSQSCIPQNCKISFGKVSSRLTKTH